CSATRKRSFSIASSTAWKTSSRVCTTRDRTTPRLNRIPGPDRPPLVPRLLDDEVAAMSLVGLDLNSTRVRAAHGSPGVPAPLALEEGRPEITLALSWEGRTPLVGRAGTALQRSKPHLACTDFLGHLGQRREWRAGRHRLDAAAALGLTFDQLRGAVGRTRG